MLSRSEVSFESNNILLFNFKTFLKNKIKFTILNPSNKPAKDLSLCLSFPQKNSKTDYEIFLKIKKLKDKTIYEVELPNRALKSIRSINKVEVKWYSYLDNDNDKLFIFPKQSKALIKFNKKPLETENAIFDDFFKLTIPFGHSKITDYNLSISNIKKNLKINKMTVYYYNKQDFLSIALKIDFPITYLKKNDQITLPYHLKRGNNNQLCPAAIVFHVENTENKEEIILYKNFTLKITEQLPYSSESFQEIVYSIILFPTSMKLKSKLNVLPSKDAPITSTTTVISGENQSLRIMYQFLIITSESDKLNLFLKFKYSINLLTSFNLNLEDLESVELKYFSIIYNHQNGIEVSRSTDSVFLEKTLLDNLPFTLVLEQQIKIDSINEKRIHYVIPKKLIINYQRHPKIEINMPKSKKEKKIIKKRAFEEQSKYIKKIKMDHPMLKTKQPVPKAKQPVPKTKPPTLNAKQITPLNINHNERLLEYNPSYLQVLSSSNNHVSKHHDIYEALVSIKYIDTNYKVRNKLIAAYWCKSCHTYFTFSESFKLQIHNSNIPFYTISTPLYNENHKPWKEEIGLNKDSVLSYYGYKVGQTHGKGVMVRHKILEAIINNNILSSDEIINHLEHLIRYNGKRKNMDYAVQDWKEDINFLNRSILKRLRK